MFYQLFHSATPKGKQSQISCDSHLEIQEELRRVNLPKFIEVHYYDERGLYGISKFMFNTLKENYSRYSRKIQN